MINALIEYRAYPVTEDGMYLVYSNANADQTLSVLNKKNRSDSHIHFYNIANCPEKYLREFDGRKSLDDILKDVFGFCAKKLKKLAVQNIFNSEDNFFDYRFLFIGEAFKDVLYPDNLYEVIEQNIFPATGNITSYSGFNAFIKDYSKEKNGAYNQKKVFNFLKSCKSPEVFTDIGDMYPRLKEAINLDIQQVGLVNDAEVIVNYLSEEFGKLSDPEFSLKVSDNFPDFHALNDVEVDNLRFLMPNTNYDLKEWTNIMQNCIHSYANNVLAARTMVFALMDKDTNEMVYNVEISRKTIIQFKSRGNNEANKNDKRKICNFLKEKGLLFKE